MRDYRTLNHVHDERHHQNTVWLGKDELHGLLLDDTHRVSQYKSIQMLQWVLVHFSWMHAEDVSLWVNQEHNPFGYVPPHDAPGLIQAAISL